MERSRPRGAVDTARTLRRVQPALRPRHHFWTQDRRQRRVDPVVDAAGSEMAVSTMTQLPRAMLIDMDDTILSAYGRPEIAWNNVAAEFADEFGQISSQQVAAEIVESGRRFWASAEAAWRLKLEEARHVVVQGGFDALAAKGHAALPLGLATRLANRFHAYREEEMFVFPGAPEAVDA